MELLVEHRFVDRRPRDDGPGYEICPLPPPELRPKATRPPAAAPSPVRTPQGAFFDPRTVDHGESIPAEAVETPKNGAQLPLTMDGAIFYDQSCSSSMHAASPENTQPDRPEATESTDQAPASPTGNDLPPAPPPALARYFLPHQWRKICTIAPAGYGLADLAGAVEKLRTRTDPHRPFHLLCAAIERGEPIYSREELEARDAELRALVEAASAKESSAKPDWPGTKKRAAPAPYYDAAQTDWGALAQAEAARVGSAATEEELLADLDEALREEAPAPALPPVSGPAPVPRTAPPPADLAALIAEAVALLGDAPPDTVERGMIAQQIRVERRTPAEAAAAVRTRRERAARPPRYGHVGD
jgi:hypothetical protein